MRLFVVLLTLIAGPATAGINSAIEVSQKQYSNFAQASAELSENAEQDCTPRYLEPHYQSAFDAWIAASISAFGPIDANGGTISISFWPDKKGFTLKSLNTLIAAQDVQKLQAEQFEELSVAGKGFMALDRLLFDGEKNTYAQESYTCELVKAIAGDLAKKAKTMSDDWNGEFATALKTAGVESNQQFLSADEVAQAYLTSLLGTLEFAIGSRLARPIGTLGNPRPKRAEAWRSNRPLRNIKVSLVATLEMVQALSKEGTPQTQSALKTAIDFIPQIESTDFQKLAETSTSFKLVSLQQMLILAQEALNVELGIALGVSSGFNSLDGD